MPSFEASSGTAWQTDHSAEHEGLIVPSGNYVGKAQTCTNSATDSTDDQVITGYLQFLALG